MLLVTLTYILVTYILDPSFTLPDTPTQIAQIFPKCPPKKSPQAAGADEPFESFADFSSTDQAINQGGTETQTESKDDGFGGFADFSSVAADVQTTADAFGDFASPAAASLPSAPATTFEDNKKWVKGQLILMAIDIIPAAVASDLKSMLLICELKHALNQMMQMMQPFHNSAFVNMPSKVQC